MIDGTIYKITDNTNGNVYYGSTDMTLKERMRKHKSSHKAYNNGSVKDYCYSYKILDNGDYTAEIVEQDLYENKEAMLWRERYYFENYECVNKNRPIITEEERLQTLKECTKSYIINNKDKINAKGREDYANNREVKLAKNNKYYTDNKDEINAKRKEKRDNNIEEYREKDKKRYHKNMEDPAFKEKERVRNRERGRAKARAKKERKKEAEENKQMGVEDLKQNRKINVAVTVNISTDGVDHN